MKKAALLLLCIVIVAGGIFLLLPEAKGDAYGPGDEAWHEGMDQAEAACEQIAEQMGGAGAPFQVEGIFVVDQEGEPTGEYIVEFECTVDSGASYVDREWFDCARCLYQQ